MLNMIKGCRISDPSILNEEYARTETGFAANVNAEKIQSVLECFVKLHNEYCFVILEVPTNAKEEAVLRSDDTAPLHKDVYYLDGLTPERALDFLNVFGEWFVHDGLSTFGIGIHSGANEILVGKYNVVTIYTHTPQRYAGFFEACGIQEAAQLKTAWDYFTRETPGDSFVYTHKGYDIYGLVEHLKQYGLYFAERREDWNER